MNRNLPILSLILLTILSGYLSAQPASKSGSASLEIILVEASNSGGGIDRSLQPYAGNLKRLFRFDSYREVQRSQTRLDLPGSTNLSLKNGTTLQIKGSNDGQTLQADLNWKRKGSSLLHTNLRLKKGTPAVLGGPRSKNGSYLLIITRK
ncbi:MAG: hypothetical protein AAGH40_00940 [Verrucomicrobiota bacterium]